MIAQKILTSACAGIFMAAASYVAQSEAKDPLPPKNGVKFELGNVTSTPIGYAGEGKVVGFCQSHPSECSGGSQSDQIIKVTGKSWEIINTINKSVNSSFEPKTDMEIYGVEERWEYPEKSADCEDFVLEKRKRLHAENPKLFPLSAMLITVVLKPDKEGHAILTLRTDGGDFVLDNLEKNIRSVGETGYTNLKLVDPRNFKRFVSILSPNGIQVKEEKTVTADVQADKADAPGKKAAPAIPAGPGLY